MLKYILLAVVLFCAPLHAQTALEDLRSLSPQAAAAPEPPRLAGHAADADAGGPAGFPAQAAAAYRSLPDYITLHVIPSPAPMDWDSVGMLALSYARNKIEVDHFGETHAIGHVSFEIGCTRPDGSRVFLMTGQSPMHFGDFTGLVKQGSGYGAFFGTVPGRLQGEDEMNKDLTSLSLQKNEVAFVTMKVSNASCLEAVRYMEAYREKGVYKRYGLGVRPLYAEGGGCANVGASVVEVAGPSDFGLFSQKWSRTIYLPKKLMGTPEAPVGLASVVPHAFDNWTRKPSYPSRKLFFYDPDLIYDWTLLAYKSGLAEGRPAARYSINRAPGILLDYSAGSSPTSWWRTDDGHEE